MHAYTRAHAHAHTCTCMHNACTHTCTHMCALTHTCPSSSRSPGRCALVLPRPQLAPTSALGPTTHAAPARTQSATRQERLCPPPGEGVGVGGRTLTLTAILRMDALTEVHLSCLRSMTRMNPMPASCRLKRESTVSVRPEVRPWLRRVSRKSRGEWPPLKPSHHSCSTGCHSQGRTEPPAALPQAQRAPPLQGSLRPRWTDRRHIASCPDTDQLAVQRGGPGPSIPEPSCSTGAWQLPFHVDLPAGPSQGAYSPGVT